MCRKSCAAAAQGESEGQGGAAEALPRHRRTPRRGRIKPCMHVYGQQPERTGFLTIPGILAIVFGAIMVLAEIVDAIAAVLLFLAPPFPGDPATEDAIRTMTAFFTVRAGVMEAMSIACIVVGVGLVRHRPLARVFANVWSVAAINLVLLRVLCWELVVVPRMQAALFEQLAKILPISAFTRAHRTWDLEWVISLMLLMFPIAVLGCVNQRPARDALAAAQPRRPMGYYRRG